MIFLDLETTGFDPKEDKIIEFSAVRVDDDFQVLETLDFMVNPEKEIPKQVIQITGIEQADVENAQPFSARVDEVRKFLQDDVIIGHNISFDISFLQNYSLLETNESIDTCDIATITFPGHASYALEVLSDVLGIEHQYKHRALGDVLACVDLMKVAAASVQALSENFWNRYLQSENKIPKVLSRFISVLKNVKNPKPYNVIPYETSDDTHVYFSRRLTDITEKMKRGVVCVAPQIVLEKWHKLYPENFKPLYKQQSYLNYSQMQEFLQKDAFSDAQALLLIKILRNQSEGMDMNEKALDIHYHDRPEFQMLVKNDPKSVLDEKKYNAVSLEAVLKDEVDMKNTSALVYGWSEKMLDKMSHQIISKFRIDKAFPESLLKKKMFELFHDLQLYLFPRSEDIGPYGKQKVISDDMYKDQAFIKIQHDFINFLSESSFEQGVSPFINILSDFFSSHPAIRFVVLKSDGDMVFHHVPLSYSPEQYFQKDTEIMEYNEIKNLEYSSQILGKTYQDQAFREYKIQFPKNPNFPSAKNPRFLESVKTEIEETLKQDFGKILYMGASKRQVEELFLYFSLHPDYKDIVFLSSVGAGGRSKILHKLKSHKKCIFFSSYDFLMNLEEEPLHFDKLILLKLPFDAPSNPMQKMRSHLFGNDFADYSLPKMAELILSLLSIVSHDELYCYDLNMQQRWAYPLSQYFTW